MQGKGRVGQWGKKSKRTIILYGYTLFVRAFFALVALLFLPVCKPAQRPLQSPSAPQDAAVGLSPVEIEVCMQEYMSISRMLALGSSSVAGSGASDVAHRFVNIIAASLEAQDLLNLGSGGQRATQVLGERAAQARDYKPDLLVVMPFSDYAYSDGPTMIEAWRQILQPIASDGAQIFFGDLRIDPDWICGGPPTPNGECYDQSTADMLNEKNRLAAQVLAPIQGLHIVGVDDVNAAHPEWILPDGHFNDAGHAHLAQVFLRAIEQALPALRCPFDADAGADAGD